MTVPEKTWTRETVRSELYALLGEHLSHAAGAAITDKSHLVGDLGVDSLGVMEIVAAVEDSFKLTIPDDALREVETVGRRRRRHRGAARSRRGGSPK